MSLRNLLDKWRREDPDEHRESLKVLMQSLPEKFSPESLKEMGIEDLNCCPTCRRPW